MSALNLMAECYANESIAKEIKEILNNVGICVDKIYHSPTFGRDKVIAKAKRISKEKRPLMIVIDFERGRSRKYIEELFEFEQISDGIIAGFSKRFKIIAVVFDPNVEEAFLCKILKEGCDRHNILKKLKSKEANRIVKEILLHNAAKDTLKNIVDKICVLIHYLQKLC